MRKNKMKQKEEKKGTLLIFIGLIILLVGYIMGCAFPPSHFLPASEVPVNEVDEELSKGIGYIDKTITLTEQGQYDKAQEKLENANESSNTVLRYIRPYEEGGKYLRTLTLCMKNLVHVTKLSKTNNTSETIEYINKFLADFSTLEDIGAELTDGKYPGIAERLNIEETMVTLKSIEYDMQDFKEESKKNATVLPPPISFEGELKEFKWKDHLGKEWSFEVKISNRKYEKYMKLPHEMKENKDILRFVTDEDAQINEIGEWFSNTYSDREDEANCILSFVQECIMSIPEEDIEYFRYPIETIIEGGDCEDKSILFVSIMKAEGYDVAFVTFPYHEMGGVALREELKRVKNPEYRIPSYLFSIEAGLEDDLSKRVISEKLIIVFEKNSFPLSDNATVTSKRDGEWNINDGEKFIIRRKEGELKVYYSPHSEKKKEYYLCETLERDFKIGSIPEEYKEMKYNVLAIPN